MFKKNSWVVALLLALTLTALFIGCIEALAEEEDNETYTEVPLGKFNQWGGQKASQAGWSVAGTVSNEGITAKDLGYKASDFGNARFLVIETNSDSTGGVDLIWGISDADGNTIEGWKQVNSVQNAPIGSFNKDTKTLTIDLKKAIKDSRFRTAAKQKIIIQHPAMDTWVVSAKLLVPEFKFVPVTDISLNAVGVPNGETTLEPVITPELATEQGVLWSIIGFLPDGTVDIADNWEKPPLSTAGTFTTDLATYVSTYVGFKTTTTTVTTVKEVSYMDYSYLPPKKIILLAGDSSSPVTTNVNNVLIAKQKGKVKVRATILEGGKDEKDFTKEFIFSVVDPLTATLNASTVAFGRNTDSATSNIDGVNGKVTVKSAYFTTNGSGNATSELLYNGKAVWIDVTTAEVELTAPLANIPVGATVEYYVDGGNNYLLNSNRAGGNDSTRIYYKEGTVTYTPSGNTTGDDATNVKKTGANGGGRWSYGNGASWVAIQFTLPSGKKLEDYSHLMFTLTGVSGDVWYKDPLQIHVSNTPFDPLTAWLDNSGGATAKTSNNLISSGNPSASVQVALGATSTSNVVYIALYYHAPGWNNSPFEVNEINYSDIKLVPKP